LRKGEAGRENISDRADIIYLKIWRKDLNIHCYYRDFFLFLKMMNLEKDPWRAFRRYYFDRYRDYFSCLWFEYQGYTLKNIRERVLSIRKEDYSDVEEALKLYDIEESTRETLVHLRSILHYHEVCNIYLFIGFFSPDMFVMKFGGDYVICCGLERFHNFKNYPLLLSHEFCHFVHKKLHGEEEDTLSARLVNEGLSVYFSSVAFPGLRPYQYLFMKRANYNTLEEKYPCIRKAILNGEIKDDDLFHGASDKFPPRTGYFIGYKMVLEFVNRRGIKDTEKLIEKCREIQLDFFSE